MDFRSPKLRFVLYLFSNVLFSKSLRVTILVRKFSMQRLSTDISAVGENFNQLYNVYNFTSGGRSTAASYHIPRSACSAASKTCLAKTDEELSLRWFLDFGRIELVLSSSCFRWNSS